MCAVTFEELGDGAPANRRGDRRADRYSGFPKGNIFKTSQKTSDVPGAFDAANVLLTQHPDVKHWLICGMNDSAVIETVSAMEGRWIAANNVIGVGINGTDALVEFRKEKPTGFFGSILLTPKRHGYETAEMLFKWINDNAEPPKATYTSGIFITRAIPLKRS